MTGSAGVLITWPMPHSSVRLASHQACTPACRRSRRSVSAARLGWCLAVVAAIASGMSVILGEHTGTERGYLPRLATRLAAELPGCVAIVSRADVDPLHPI